MRVICPHCQKSVALPDEQAELPTPCPECGNIFAAPMLMPAPESAISPGVATPGLSVPVVETIPLKPAEPTPAFPVSAGQTAAPKPPPAAPAGPGAAKLRLTREFVRFVGPIGVFLFFVLCFFTWIGSYAGGYPAYTQTGWQGVNGGFATDAAAEGIVQREDDLKTASTWGTLMLFASILLVPTFLVAMLDLFEEFITFSVPDVVNYVWPHRRSIMTLATFLLWLLVTAQFTTGLSLEKAALAATEKRVIAPNAPPEKPDLGTKVKLDRDLNRGLEYNRYGLQRTTACWLAHFCLSAAVIGFALEYWLDRRGDRPVPSVEARW